MKVQRGNVNKYEENKHLVLGIARHGDKIAVEYISHSRSGQRHTLLAHKDRIVWHTCPACEKRQPCWHLGMAAVLWGWPVPTDVTCHPEQKIPERPYVTWQDVTMNYLGRPGDFQLIPINGAVVSEAPETPPTVEEPEIDLPNEDAWLKEYKLPARLLEKVLRFREAQKARLMPDQKQRVPTPRYLPADGELVRAVAALLYGESGEAWEAPLLIGPKGSGKSTLAETLAAILHLPVVKIFGGIDVNAEWLLGGKTLEPVEGVDPVAEAKLKVAARQAGIDMSDVLPKLKGATLKVAFEPGLLLSAVQAGEMVVVDEVNMLVPEVTSLLHGLLDWQKVLSVPGVGAVKAHPSFRLVGCMNYGYAGTKELNEAFQDRFRSVQVPHLPEELLKDLLVRETGCDADVAEKLAALFHKLAGRVENGDLPERVLSIRALMRAIREVQDGCGTLKEAAMSVLTEGLGDQYARDQVKDIVDAYVA
ncbi:MoxR-like ATPase [Thermodesulfitimonas autotrophica]|uniref:MoxR-like ATPase n=1 Tax=Thermodesulfitimonas autotrophica TaxID=1894989 RepID=A0A3N5AWY7_9THEO|nr:AAA family ATPase [Thermodesulfitimonas autotrophica]RPF49504.1 MoxR-like ATPase [Thermodesulfitimonas autotrophica]